MPSEPIVVATDLQARSDRAIDRALMIGKEAGRPIAIVHVVKEECETAQDRSLAEALVRAVLPDPAADVAILLPAGSAPRAIARVAQEQGAALLVAGVASFNQFRDYFLGTAVDYIVRHATMPVLVVKHRPHADYRSLLVAVDFSEASKQAVLAAARLFPQAALTVLHAYHVPFEGWQSAEYVRDEALERNQAELDEFLGLPDFAGIPAGRMSGRIAYGGLDRAVFDAIEELRPDLLVLGTHGESGFRHATLGSNANALLASAMIDTLMVPLPR